MVGWFCIVYAVKSFSQRTMCFGQRTVVLALATHRGTSAESDLIPVLHSWAPFGRTWWLQSPQALSGQRPPSRWRPAGARSEGAKQSRDFRTSTWKPGWTQEFGLTWGETSSSTPKILDSQETPVGRGHHLRERKTFHVPGRSFDLDPCAGRWV